MGDQNIPQKSELVWIEALEVRIRALAALCDMAEGLHDEAKFSVSRILKTLPEVEAQLHDPRYVSDIEGRRLQALLEELKPRIQRLETRTPRS
jgi:hypothetical protein